MVVDLAEVLMELEENGGYATGTCSLTNSKTLTLIVGGKR